MIAVMHTDLGCVPSLVWPLLCLNLFLSVWQHCASYTVTLLFGCRYGLLAGCVLFEGATLGPLVQIVLATHPGTLVTAFLGTSTVFACFSAAALLSRRRRYFIYVIQILLKPCCLALVCVRLLSSVACPFSRGIVTSCLAGVTNS